MNSTPDRELISRYVRRQDHDAFAELVRRYIALVRSAAVRQTREPGLADDVTQAAMIVLARRAREIPANVLLASWLFTVTHHIAQNALKSRTRRRVHEQQAATLHASRRTSIGSGNLEVRDVLDAAIARLPDIERGGVVLHYFNDCTHEQIADAMGMSSEAVRKRLSRALISLRDFVANRGIDLSTQTLAATLAAESVSRLSLHLATDSIVSVALLSATHGASATSTSAILANGILGSAKAALKWKIAATIALTAAGFTGIAMLPLPAPSVHATAVNNQSAAPTTQPDGFIAQVADNIRIRALGCAPHPADSENWFAIDGKPIDMPHETLADNQINSDSQPDRQIAFLIDSPASTRFIVDIAGAFTNSANMNQTEGQSSLMRCRFGLNDAGRETLSVAFNISTGDWKTVATAECGAEPLDVDADGLGPVTFHPPVDDARWGPRLDVRHARVDASIQLVAYDVNGKEHLHDTLNNNSDGGNDVMSSFIFQIPAKEIRSVKLQIREFDKRVEFTNIAMQADQHTEPKIVVTDLKPKK